jgi:molybdopterin-guanine dinucleotide biosynthesis protein A
MGQDKGLLTDNQEAWVARAARLLASLYLPVTVVVRQAQLEGYRAVLPSSAALVTDADLPVGGPLKGLLTVHQRYPDHDWLVLPCDMPDMTLHVLSNLITFYKANSHFTAWVFRDENQRQPLPGIYSAQLLAHLSEKIQKEELAHHGLKQVLEEGFTGEMALPKEFLPAFGNYNSPGDRLGRS